MLNLLKYAQSYYTGPLIQQFNQFEWDMGLALSLVWDSTLFLLGNYCIRPTWDVAGDPKCL